MGKIKSLHNTILRIQNTSILSIEDPPQVLKPLFPHDIRRKKQALLFHLGSIYVILISAIFLV